MPIYTKFGDAGETRLFDGRRVPKNDLRVSAYGDVDELNSVLGLAAAHSPDPEISDQILRIQGHLMALGATLANPAAEPAEEKARPKPEWIRGLEESIDRFENDLTPLKRFILPGGSVAGAHLHLARTVCRRAERSVVDLSGTVTVAPVVIEYLNRLSDLLFVLARAANHREGMEEVLW